MSETQPTIEPTEPPPLPQLEWDRVADVHARKAAEGLTHFVARLRDQVFGNADLIAGALSTVQGGLGGLQSRIKDVYLFQQRGAITSQTDPTASGLDLPRTIWADSTLMEIRVDSEQGTGVIVLVTLDLDVAGGALVPKGTTSFVQPGQTPIPLGKEQVLRAYVFDPGIGTADLVVQVRCG